MSISGRRLTLFNPMSTVDVSAIEEAMKMATLDQHRGYVKDTYGEVQQERNTEYLAKSQAAGYQVIREPLWNKGMLYLSRSFITDPSPGGKSSRYLVFNICAQFGWSLFAS